MAQYKEQLSELKDDELNQYREMVTNRSCSDYTNDPTGVLEDTKKTICHSI